MTTKTKQTKQNTNALTTVCLTQVFAFRQSRENGHLYLGSYFVVFLFVFFFFFGKRLVAETQKNSFF